MPTVSLALILSCNDSDVSKLRDTLNSTGIFQIHYFDWCPRKGGTFKINRVKKDD